MGATATKLYPVGNRRIELETSPTAFMPASSSQMLARVLHIPLGSTVADLGCGVGNLAIYSALEGAKRVHAVDLMESACELARINAIKNRVGDKVTVHCGNLFEPIPEDVMFDVIIGDLSGVADEVARLSPWFPEPVPTGGYDGTDHILGMLETAPKRLKRGGDLYLPISSLSNAPKILNAADQAFGGKIEQIWKVDYPFCTELTHGVERLRAMQNDGLIDFSKRGSLVFWTMWIYRAWS